MRVLIDKSSTKKQYVEKDNLLLVEDKDILKFDVIGGQRHFRFNSMFVLMINLLEFKDPEAAIYWTLLYTDEPYTCKVGSHVAWSCRNRPQLNI